MKLTIKLNISKCNEIDKKVGISCPFLEISRTQGAGYAEDFFCKANNSKKICGYVEWESDIPLVPDWCPFKN